MVKFSVDVDDLHFRRAKFKSLLWLDQKVQSSVGFIEQWRNLHSYSYHVQGNAEQELVTAFIALARGELDQLYEMSHG